MGRLVDTCIGVKCLLFFAALLICLPLVSGDVLAGDGNGSFWKFLDNLSDEEPSDRYAIHSGFSPRDDYLFLAGGFRARLTRRLNVVGGLLSSVWNDEDEPSYFGLSIAAHEDLIVKSNGRIYVEVHYASYHLESANKWDGGSINEFGIGCGFSQGFPFFYRIRYFFQASWNLTGKDEWKRTGGDEAPPIEHTMDFTGYQLFGGGEIIF